MVRRLSLLVPLAVVACVRATPVVAPVEVTVGTSDPNAAKIPILAGKDACTARLVSGEVDTGDGCYLNENVTKGDGTLHFPCRGDGLVQALFGDHRFEGEVKGGRLSLKLTTDWDWDEDHCHWQSQQSISGAIRGHELAWTYIDQPTQGDGCYRPCLARATIQVDPKPGAKKAPRPGRADDDDSDVEPDP